MPRKKKTEEASESKRTGLVSEKEEVKEERKKSKKAETAKKAEAKEKDSVKTEAETKAEKLEELKKKAAKLAAGIEKVDIEAMKEEIKKKEKTLVSLDDYVKTGIHFGTRVITPDMKKFVYRRRADGIAVLNTNIIDEKIKQASEFLSKFEPEEIILVCKKEIGWHSAKLFSEATGIKVFTKKYPVGMMTNLNLKEFFEPKLIIITDPWIDRNALIEAIQTNKEIISLCDTNNFVKNIDFIIPCNNKVGRSIGLIFYILAREYIKARKLKTKLPEMDDFTGEG